MLTCDVTWWAVDTLYTVTVPTTYTVSVPDPVVTYYVTPVEVRQTARWPDETFNPEPPVGPDETLNPI